MRSLRALALTMLASGLVTGPGALGAPAQKRPDLAEVAQGSYWGEVISDARGSSHSDVAITVARTGPNTIKVTSDYSRIPERTFRLTRAMQTIQNAGGNEVFLLDLSKSPHHLDLTIDDASWSGELRPPGN